ncbi:M50 family metallopeptidase [Ornithinibacillus sp. 4-3]|uniref:M50 family metallopeptidase n=1 Tax=Ornithinibacillus sp. 4-3 TaxID=3231488 RepID=A0AB39HLI3_9BACI
MDIFIIIYIVLIVAPIGTLFHETGHAIGAKLVRADKIHLSLGCGNLSYTFRLQGFRLTLHPIYFIGGFASSERNKPYHVKEKILISIFGPFCNLIIACLIYFLYVQVQNEYLFILVLFNLWLAIINLIPFTLLGKQSDGYTILKEISSAIRKKP